MMTNSDAMRSIESVCNAGRNKINGTLRTYENNCMSLSCDGKITIVNGIIREISFKGYPRLRGDSWTGFYERAQRGDVVTQEKIDQLLKYNSCCNVRSYFKENDGE